MLWLLWPGGVDCRVDQQRLSSQLIGQGYCGEGQAAHCSLRQSVDSYRLLWPEGAQALTFWSLQLLSRPHFPLTDRVTTIPRPVLLLVWRVLVGAVWVMARQVLQGLGPQQQLGCFISSLDLIWQCQDSHLPAHDRTRTVEYSPAVTTWPSLT